ncbi:hypothetical protein [Nocardia sp.]|uniref:hypothetical protein n=1 Tax=Nocardia sp. TaxID=1821 RepID=UPI0026117E9F|nr:hypothetical protein [Nocardia sp.]
MTRIAGLCLSAAAVAVSAACSSNNDATPGQTGTTTSAKPSTGATFTAPTPPPPVTRTMQTAPGDRVITQADLLWKTYGDAVITVGSGAWQPSVYNIKTMVGPESTQKHMPETGDQLNPWIVTGVCFASDYEVGLEITPQEDIPGFNAATPPREGHTAAAGRGGRCDNGFVNLNLSTPPLR